MTLSNCEWLDKKHTIFGKITGALALTLTLTPLATDPNPDADPRPRPRARPRPRPHPHPNLDRRPGNSLYNVNRFGELECDSKDQPTYPPTLATTPTHYPNPNPNPSPNPDPNPNPNPNPKPKPIPYPYPGPAHLPSEDTAYRDPARPLRRHRASGEGAPQLLVVSCSCEFVSCSCD